MMRTDVALVYAAYARPDRAARAMPAGSAPASSPPPTSRAHPATAAAVASVQRRDGTARRAATPMRPANAGAEPIVTTVAIRDGRCGPRPRRTPSGRR
ncbi:hypothetical protein BJF79_37335 [Actinomadura sp. CNU-125]|nr:hypothetical protein BJF79_37335 [Actinomadura sp. CNU-125]